LSRVSGKGTHPLKKKGAMKKGKEQSHATISEKTKTGKMRRWKRPSGEKKKT